MSEAARHRCAADAARRVVAASFDIRQRLFRIKGRWRQPRVERERIHLPPERVKVVGDACSRKYGQQFDRPGPQAPPYCQIRVTGLGGTQALRSNSQRAGCDR
jgi:hypothetical protein